LTELWDGFVQAIQLIVSFDRGVMEVAWRSLWIAVTSCTIAMLICLPLGCLIHFRSFPGKRLLISVIQTLYSIPTVLVGLLVFMFVSNAGPLGGLSLLFTPGAIIVGQVILISPIMLGLIISALSGVDKMVTETALSLGATRVQAAIVSVREVRYAIVTALVMGFGRAISEIGIALIVGRSR
jgi:tungstate transport system permease protein